MKAESMTVVEWQERFATEDACLDYLEKERWGVGFKCPRCSHTQYWYTSGYRLYECKQCYLQTSPTSNTIFHGTKIPLVKWFWAIYFSSVDKGGISASRLSRHLNVSWNTARFMLKRLRACMGDRDQQYLLSGLIELDEALVGGKKSGGKGPADGKARVLVACENRGERAGHLKMEVVDKTNKETVANFSSKTLQSSQDLRTDGCPTLKTLEGPHRVESLVLPPSEVCRWLPWVHVAIANLKRFLLGTYHGVSPEHLQEYLDEFCYRFNRRRFELQIPLRLTKACVSHPRLSVNSVFA